MERFRTLAARTAIASLLLTGGARPLSATGATSAEENGAAPDGYLSERLANGLSVSILPDPESPIVATQVWYHVGSANEEAASRGLAHLFEHLMFGATASHAKEEYTSVHHRAGGEENAFTSPDETVYVSEIPPEAHEAVLALEADRMTNLRIDAANLENEKKIVTEELRLRTENDPMSRLLVAAQRALLGSHPYAYDASGEKDDVAAASVESCRAFYEAHYHPNRAHLVIVGPVDGKRTQAAVERLFGSLPPGGVDVPDVPSLAGWHFPAEVDLHEDLPPVEIAAFGFPLPDADSEDRFAIDVLLEILSGSAVDPFREELVARRHKALEAGTEALRLRRGGALFFYAASLPYRRKATAFRNMEKTREELSRLSWLTDERVESAKRALLRAELQAVYRPAERADRIGRAAWHEGDERFAFGRARRVASVTPAQVRAAWRTYVGDASPVRLYARPDHVPLLIRLFGWIVPLIDR